MNLWQKAIDKKINFKSDLQGIFKLLKNILKTENL